MRRRDVSFLMLLGLLASPSTARPAGPGASETRRLGGALGHPTATCDRRKDEENGSQETKQRSNEANEDERRRTTTISRGRHGRHGRRAARRRLSSAPF